MTHITPWGHMARKHWEKELPTKTAALKALGVFEEEMEMVAEQARDMAVELIQRGVKVFSAKEIAIAEFILVPSEPKDQETTE